jgi:hypothetical protein
MAHCAHQEPTLREDHARYLLDPACGEAWEHIQIGIIADDLLPRSHARGTGLIRFITGMVVIIEAYELDLAMDNSTGTLHLEDAHLRLAAPEGHILKLDLVKSRPFRSNDFFPSWEDTPPGTPVMVGPVLRGTDTLGQVRLYGDRSLTFLDAAGRTVTPE